MADRFSCAMASLRLGEPSYGTASQVRRWLLVEQPGAWGADAVMESNLPRAVAVQLRGVARRIGARLLLIRRHGRSDPDRRTAFAAATTPEVRRIERFVFDDPGELCQIDWTPLRSFDPVGGEEVDSPLYLVCTNGSHDACCAQFGRPVAKALDTVLGERVWESSHFGGDRFAGNLVCLPDAIYYGRVDPLGALRLVERHQEGLLDLEHLRGRSFQPFVAQAGEHFVREARGLTVVDAVLARQTEDLGEGLFRVGVSTSAGEVVQVTVACSDAVDPQQLTCKSSTEEYPPRFRLVGFE